MSRELEKISEILDANPQISELVLHDLCDTRSAKMGASGLSADYTLRAAILKQLYGFSYQQLAFHVMDSQSFGTFLRQPLGWIPNQSTLQRNIAAIRADTWKVINGHLVGWAAQKGLEKGERSRVDATAVESDIHHPTDSSLLYDSVRKVSSLLQALNEEQGQASGAEDSRRVVPFMDHTRRAKRRAHDVANRRGRRREESYRDLLKVAHKTYGYGQRALQLQLPVLSPWTIVLLESLKHYLSLMARVLDQTERRILRGESVPAEEKVLSIFEEHTDIIKKGGREPVFGHKIYLTTGATSLVLNCDVKRGNPADSSQFRPLLEAHHDLFGSYPRQMAADRGFYSGPNLKWAKERVQDVAFDRKAGAKISEMARSTWIYKQLTRFRAGIEGCISWLKRVFGLDRCTWKGWSHFQQYVHASVVSYNLVVLARLLL